jgi:hypothetical protein
MQSRLVFGLYDLILSFRLSFLGWSNKTFFILSHPTAIGKFIGNFNRECRRWATNRNTTSPVSHHITHDLPMEPLHWATTCHPTFSHHIQHWATIYPTDPLSHYTQLTHWDIIPTLLTHWTTALHLTMEPSHQVRNHIFYWLTTSLHWDTTSQVEILNHPF